ncbi:alpha/beta hydrolase fold domain-containing protein, partial [Acinetobacter baumannii]|uniref:alpha/beta hydrolase fold domain-containing protein n=1 Tax=Acinetobacter baumannii TaxID=470 RepID=UPI0011C0DD29
CDSAGGNLAAAVALALRDEQLYSPLCQILIYPCLDLNSTKRDKNHSFNINALNPPLTADQMSIMMNMYVQNKSQTEEWMASPIKAESHENLPPALILTASL